MKYYLTFPVKGDFWEDPPFIQNGEVQEPAFDQFFSGPVELSTQEMTKYEREIDSALHAEEDTHPMQDNTGILVELEKDWLREKIEWVDLSVHTENGCLVGRFTISTKEPLTEHEDEFLSAYLWKQFDRNWIENMQRKGIPVSGGTLFLQPGEPSMYQLVKEKKYEITDIAHPKYWWLHRIQALVRVNEQVGKGDYGGFIQSESNLSQEGGCWIYDNAICCEDAVVKKEARMFDDAIARDSALITGNSCLFDSAAAEGNCCIRSGEVKEHARIAGDAVLSESVLDGLSPLIAGDSNVYGEVRGAFVVKDVVLPGETLINPTADLFILENSKRRVLVRSREQEAEFQPIKKKKKEMER